MATALCLNGHALIAARLYVQINETQSFLIELKRAFNRLVEQMTDEERKELQQFFFDNALPPLPSARH